MLHSFGQSFMIVFSLRLHVCFDGNVYCRKLGLEYSAT